MNDSVPYCGTRMVKAPADTDALASGSEYPLIQTETSVPSGATAEPMVAVPTKTCGIVFASTGGNNKTSSRAEL